MIHTVDISSSVFISAHTSPLTDVFFLAHHAEFWTCIVLPQSVLRFCSYNSRPFCSILLAHDLPAVHHVIRLRNCDVARHRVGVDLGEIEVSEPFLGSPSTTNEPFQVVDPVENKFPRLQHQLESGADRWEPVGRYP